MLFFLIVQFGHLGYASLEKTFFNSLQQFKYDKDYLFFEERVPLGYSYLSTFSVLSTFKDHLVFPFLLKSTLIICISWKRLQSVL